MPETVRVIWCGKLPPGVMAKDMSLFTISAIGHAGATYQAVEMGAKAGMVAADQAYVGSCTGGLYSDLEAAAAILKGRRVKNGVRLLVSPASQEIWRQACASGVLETLADAGAVILAPTCGVCVGLHSGLLADGEVCIPATNRNFIGRMDSKNASFAARVVKGDIMVAGANFGSGSSRETSPLTLKYLGIGAIVAKFFARIFYRNAINLGLPVIECVQADRIADGDLIEIDLTQGTINNRTKGEIYACSRIPPHILALIAAGGLVPYLKNTVWGQ